LPEYIEPTENGSGGTRVRALNLDIIKRRLDKGLYKRLDLFQRDIFCVLERARKLSRTDSQVFEDSIELQSFFIKTRDEACEHGEILQSRALLYTQSDLMRAVEELRAQKQLSEQPEDDGGADGSGARAEGGDSTPSATFNMQQVISPLIFSDQRKIL
jgi:protein polybromo-1